MSQRTKLAVAVTNLGPTQLNYFMIARVNQLMGQRHDVDFIAFYENLFRPCVPTMNFASMQLVEAYGYDGTIIATTLLTADKVLKFPGPKRKLFYVWDLEWLRIQDKHYSTLKSIYANPNIALIARSKEHQRAIEDCWNRNVSYVVDDFNIEAIVGLCQ